MSDIGMCVASLVPDPLAPTPDDLRAAVDATAAAGFTRTSVWGWHVPLLGGHHAGLELTVVEAAIHWAGDDDGAARAEVDEFRAAVETMGALHVLATILEPTLADEARAQARLGALVDAVEEAGATVCLEFLPWSGIPDLATAWRLVEPLGPAAGLTVDTWHWTRQPGGPAPELLASIPAERLRFVQLSDVAPVAGEEVMAETMTNRLLPGDGVVDYASFFDALATAGASPFVAVEIFNPSLVAELGVAGAAEAMRKSASAVVG